MRMKRINDDIEWLKIDGDDGEEMIGWDFTEWDGEAMRDYQIELDDIPLEEIERYLRKKKLERIKEIKSRK